MGMQWPPAVTPDNSGNNRNTRSYDDDLFQQVNSQTRSEV